mmetsp:Transcript_28823/g.68977  ORF Transcript_28823/g.68977 Transcript_28823/m.68977 type:complete len:350 (-) Transcript_28823:941-1990(-)
MPSFSMRPSSTSMSKTKSYSLPSRVILPPPTVFLLSPAESTTSPTGSHLLAAALQANANAFDPWRITRVWPSVAPGASSASGPGSRSSCSCEPMVWLAMVEFASSFSHSFIASSPACRSSLCVNTLAFPSAHPVAMSPLGSAVTDHTVSGCLMMLTHLLSRQTRTVRSSPPLTMSPLGSTASAYTKFVCPTRVARQKPQVCSRELPARSSDQILIVLSLPAETKRPSGRSARARTQSVWPLRVPTHSSWSHSLIDRSAEAERSLPWRRGRRAHTACECPFSSNWCSSVLRSHTLIVLSHDAEYSLSPSGLEARKETVPLCPPRDFLSWPLGDQTLTTGGIDTCPAVVRS